MLSLHSSRGLKVERRYMFGLEFCSLLKWFCSFPSEMTKIPLRDLSHASVLFT